MWSPMLRTRLGFWGLGSLTLALAVGANVLVFTVVNTLWFRPSPVHDPERVVTFFAYEAGAKNAPPTGAMGWTDNAGFGEGMYPDFLELGVFERMAGQVITAGFGAPSLPRIRLDADAAEVSALGVTWEYFQVLGLPVHGRDFTRKVRAEPFEATVLALRLLWVD